MPARGQLRADRRAGHLRRHLDHLAVSALPVTQDAPGTTRRCSARRTRTTRCWGSSPRSGCTATVCRPRSRYYVGILAATILIIATNAGLIGISRLSWSLAEHRQLPGIFARVHPQLPHAVVHDRLLLRARGAAADPGEDRLPGQPLQLRGDAVVHDRARRDRGAARTRSRTASARTAVPWNVPFRGGEPAARRGARRDRHVRRLGVGGGAARGGAHGRHRAGW